MWRIEDGMNNTIIYHDRNSSEYPLINITFFFYETQVFRKFEKLMETYTFGTYKQVDSILQETIVALTELYHTYSSMLRSFCRIFRNNIEGMPMINCKQGQKAAICGDTILMKFQLELFPFPGPEYKEEMDQKFNFLFD